MNFSIFWNEVSSQDIGITFDTDRVKQLMEQAYQRGQAAERIHQGNVARSNYQRGYEAGRSDVILQRAANLDPRQLPS